MEYTLDRVAVALAGVSLTGEVGITGFRINGQHVVDVVALVRATTSKPFGKGNSTQAIAFTALRRFANMEDLEWFRLVHFGALVKSGALQIAVGSRTAAAAEAAVHTVDFGDPEGLMLPVSYTLTCSPLIAI